MPDSDIVGHDDISEVLHIRRARRLSIATVGVAVLIIGLLTTVLLLVKTVSFTISPERAVESSNVVSTKGLSITIGRNVHFLGAIEVEAAAEGFFPQSIALDRASESPMSVELEPRPGVVAIELDFVLNELRSEYSLSIDDTQLYESVPNDVELPSGRYTLRLFGPQEYDSTQLIEVIGYGKKQVASFAALPYGSFTVRVVPDTADIKLNGDWIGVGTVQRTVVAKSHVLEFEEEGYLSKRLPFSVETASQVDLGTVTLSNAPGTVKFTSNPTAASILIDGQFVGSTPTELKFDKTDIQVELRKSNFHSVSAKVEISPGNTLTREFTLLPVRFDVEVSSEPQATLVLNDENLGLTPLKAKVTAGDVLSVSKDGYVTQTVTIAAAEQQQRQLNVVLVDTAQHLYNEAPGVITVQDSIELKKFPSANFQLLVPRFLMEDDRQRVRKFAISRPFYFGVHEIRRKEYAKFDSSINTTPTDENLPVTDISWLEAVKFCNWLSQTEGLEPVYSIANETQVSVNLNSDGYRLPTEAEWELVTYYHFAHGRVVGPFVWGEGIKAPTAIGNLAGYETRSAMHTYLSDYADNHKELAPVGSYRRNFNGIHDLIGNVAEWVHDYFGTPYSGWDEELIDPMGPSRGIDRIAKGANFQTTKLHETAINFRRTVGYKDETVGFRIARWVL